MAAMLKAGLLFAVSVGLVRAYTAADMLTMWEFTASATQPTARSMVMDEEGTAFIVGYVKSSLLGATYNGGSWDHFVLGITSGNTGYSSDLLGTSESDRGYGIAIEGVGSHVAVGRTFGDMDGQGNQGGADIFVVRTTGDQRQVFQFGSDNSGDDYAYDVAVTKAGNIVVVGETDEFFPGQTNAGLSDMYVMMFDRNMTHAWTFQTGTSENDWAWNVVANDAGDVFVTVLTKGDFAGFTNQGDRDVYLMKLFADGNQNWTVQIATDGEDVGTGLRMSPDGTYLVAVGETKGTFPGYTFQGGSYDIFVSKVMVDGTHAWTSQMGTDGSDEIATVAFNHAGEMIIAGMTTGNFVPATGVAHALIINVNADNGTATWIWQDPFSEPIVVHGMAIDAHDDIVYEAHTDTDLYVRKVRLNISTTSTSTSTSTTPTTITSTTTSTSPSTTTSTTTSTSVTTVSSKSTSTTTSTTTSSMSTRSSTTSTVTTATLRSPFLLTAGSVQTIWEYSVQADSLQSRQMAVDQAGNAFIVGFAAEVLPNSSTAYQGGAYDAYSHQVSADGAVVSTEMIGTPTDDRGVAIAIAQDGTRYVCGRTMSDLAGAGSHQGNQDAYVMKTHPDGTQEFTQFGTTARDVCFDVRVNQAGHFAVTGFTEGDLSGSNAGRRDGYVRMFQSDMTPLWTTQFGTDVHDQPEALVLTDAGDVFVWFETAGSFGGHTEGREDGVVLHLASDGSLGWRLRIGTPMREFARAMEMSPDGTYLALAGVTQGSFRGFLFQGGNYDIFVSKVLVDGTHVWTTQMGTPYDDSVYAIAFSSQGEMLIGGSTGGNYLEPSMSSTGQDIVIINMADDGTPTWIFQEAYSFKMDLRALAFDHNGDLIYSGFDDDGSGMMYVKKARTCSEGLCTSTSTTSAPMVVVSGASKQKVSTVLTIGGVALPLFILLDLLHLESRLNQ